MSKGLLSPVGKTYGFTLIDATITVAIIAIVSAIAVPQFNQFVVSRDFKNATRDIVGDIFELKQRALSEDTKHRIEFHAESNTYDILRCSSTGSSCDTYTVLLATKSPSSFRNGIIIKEAVFGSGQSITFQTRGTASMGHVLLTNGEMNAKITVNITGRTYVVCN